MRWGVDAAVAMLCGAVILLAGSYAALLQTEWLLEFYSSVTVGMTEEDAISRLGEPGAVGEPGDDLSWQRGFTHSDRPVEGRVLTWVRYGPLLHGWRMYAYIGPDGCVSCCFLGWT